MNHADRSVRCRNFDCAGGFRYATKGSSNFSGRDARLDSKELLHLHCPADYRISEKLPVKFYTHVHLASKHFVCTVMKQKARHSWARVSAVWLFSLQTSPRRAFCGIFAQLCTVNTLTRAYLLVPSKKPPPDFAAFSAIYVDDAPPSFFLFT